MITKLDFQNFQNKSGFISASVWELPKEIPHIASKPT